MGQALNGDETFGQEGREFTEKIRTKNPDVGHRTRTEATDFLSAEVRATCLRYLEHYIADNQHLPVTSTLIDARNLSEKIRNFQQK